MVELQR